MNFFIQKSLQSNKQMVSRLKTDRLFLLPAGSAEFRGPFDRAARFIEKTQLLDVSLWQKFVAVFSAEDKPDTPNGSWKCEFWGKVMRGACVTYGYTQNEELLGVLTQTVKNMINAAEPDGRISAYEREKDFRGWDIWGRKYVMLGLLYFYEICPDSALKEDVLQAACKEADSVLAFVGENKMRITDTSDIWAGLNSSSVLEPIVRLYALTEEEKYLQFAAHIVNCGGNRTENLFEKAYEGKLPPSEFEITKAYEMMSCFEGLIEYYRVTGIEKWKTAAVNLGKMIAAYETTVIGNCGSLHELFDNAAKNQSRIDFHGVMEETCVAVTYLKFCLQLLCLTGDSSFGDEIERTAYNSVLGAVNYTGNGLPFDSYTPLTGGLRGREIGGFQRLPDGSYYGCCGAIGSVATGLIPFAAVLAAEKGFAFNLYIPGFAAGQTPSGERVEFSVETGYPEKGNITVKVDTTDEAPFSLFFRIPAWSKQCKLSAAGEEIAVRAGEFAEINRVWHCGDTVTLQLDMRGRMFCPPQGAPDGDLLFAVCRGPLTLARDVRLGGDVFSAVEPAADAEGYLEIIPFETEEFPHNYAFQMRKRDGGFLKLLDAASAGNTMNEDSLYTVFLRKNEHPAIDFSKPFYLQKALRMAYACNNKQEPFPKCFLSVNEAGEPVGSSEQKTELVATARKDGEFHIMCGDLLLNADEEGKAVFAKRGLTFRAVPAGPNRIFLKTDKNKFLMMHRDGRILLHESHGSPDDLFEIENC